MIGHLVLFNAKPEATDEQLRSFARAISEACRQIPSIQRVQIGRRVTVDAGYPRSFGEKTYNYAAVFEFRDTAALKQYLNHPLHHQLGRMFWEMCEATTVVEVELADGKSDQLVDFLLLDRN
ncbi:MAG TPA: Dabb family protein [Vicinamibacterales bacterium]|nr:Dabb family protein [Vicinamibacterales bacterium]